MTDDKANDKNWKDMRDHSNAATLESSEALKDDALTDGKLTLKSSEEE